MFSADARGDPQGYLQVQTVDAYGQGLVVYVGYERTNCVEAAQGFVQTVDAQDHVLVACVCYDRTNRVATAQGCVRAFEGDASDDDKGRDVCTVLAIVGSSASVGAA